MTQRVENEAAERISITSMVSYKIWVVKPSLPGSINTLVPGNNIAEGAECRVMGSPLAHIVELHRGSCFQVETLERLTTLADTKRIYE